MSGGSIKTMIVKQVLSGDSIVVRDQPKGGPPEETTLYLSSIAAPKLAKRIPAGNLNGEESKDEPYAWEAREFLRKKLIGAKVSYTTEKPSNATREYSVVYLAKDTPNEENINETLIKEGFVTVRGPNPRYKELEEQAKAAGKGKYSKTENEQDHVRDIKWNITSETMQYLTDSFKGKPVKAVIEHIRDGSTVRCFIQDDNGTFYHITLMISGIRCPGYKIIDSKPGPPEEYAELAKFFVECRLLNQDIEVTLDSISGSNLVGSIIHPKGNIAELLLKEGFAKCLDWTMKFVKNPEIFRKAERSAKEKQLRLWKNWKPSAPAYSGSEKEYQATVLEVGLGDNLIVKKADGTEKKIFLASIKPPRSGEDVQKGKRPLYDIPWMFECREFLRKKLIGKKVNIITDYVQPPPKDMPNIQQEKICCTVTINGVNVAEALVSKGLATVIKHRSDDDRRSSQYDSLYAAEQKAMKNLKGVHSKKDTPIHRINDYSADSSKSRNLLPHLKRTSGRTEALVEFVFSGSRLRLYIAKDSCVIVFLLAGISCPRGPRKTADNVVIPGDPFGEEALAFTKERVMQREVEITFEGIDKAGNFIGWLWVDNVNLSVALVQEGLSEVHFSAERSEYYRALMDAQNSAKSKKLNIFKNRPEEEDKDKVKDEEETITERKIDYQKVVVIEVTDELHIFTQVEEHCSKLDALLVKLRQELVNVTKGAYTPKRGDLCAAKFSGDGLWYRAKIEKVTGSKVRVFFIDYGNRDDIDSLSCAALPMEFSSIKPFAQENGLAFVKFALDIEEKEQSMIILREVLLNRSVLLNVEYRVTGFPYVTLYDTEDKHDLIKGIVEDGYLLVDKRSDRRLRKVMDEYKAAQELALKGHKGIWIYGDIREDDDKEFGMGR